MIVGSRPQSGDALAISSKVRSAVKSIKEVVGDHSESDIYAVLKETNMDPDEAAQKLLNQDPFHEVRRRRDRKKEALQNGSCNNVADDTTVQETRTEWKNPDRLWDRNGRAGRGGYTKPGRGGYSRPVPPDPVKEFRVVRDNRIKQKVDEDVTPAIGLSSDLSNGKVALDNVDNSSKEESITQKPSLLTTSAAPVVDSKKYGQLNSNHVVSLPRKEHRAEICSSSDPIHINVGLRRREVGVVGLWKPNADYESRNLTSVSNGNRSFTSENPRHVRPNSRSNRPPQPLAAENGTRSAHVSQYNGKVFQQSVSHQKAQQPNMEWRPKSSQSSKVSKSLTDQNQTEVAILSETLANSNVSEDQHVIIPEHLRVPDSEKTSLVFGSFDAVKCSKETDNHSSSSDVLELPSETAKPDIERTETNEAQLRADSDLQILDEGTQNNSDPCTESISQYESTLPHDLQENPSDIQSFQLETQEYEPHSRYDMQFLSSVGADSVGTQDVTVMSTEGMISRPTSTSQILTHPAALQQQQNAVQNQQHQQVPQMYQQMQLPTFPNYMPYRHVFPPVYVPPQMAVQNYANTPAYPHPTQGNSYLLMPTSSPTQVAAGGLKYSTNQYKPVFTGSGYGNYTNPSNGYPVTPGVIGPVATFDDSNRVKFKDNNLYMPSQQVEASDIWVQNPRELPNMPSGAFYNVPAQPPNAAFLPSLNGSASFNAAPQPQHVQYPSLHHTGQPGSMALMPPGPHNMVHQQVPPSGLGPNMGVGVVAPPFQQNHQLGPIGWTANF